MLNIRLGLPGLFAGVSASSFEAAGLKAANAGAALGVSFAGSLEPNGLNAPRAEEAAGADAAGAAGAARDAVSFFADSNGLNGLKAAAA